MSKIRLYGDSSGYSEIVAQNATGDLQFDLPGTGGTLDRLNRAGNVLQVVNYQTGAVATGTTVIPGDDTIPQNTEGDEYMTLAITPTSASNKLRITVCVHGAVATVPRTWSAALFQDSTSNALANGAFSQTTAGFISSVFYSHFMTAGTTSSTTFKVRCGPSSAATFTFNGVTGGRLYGGVIASSITIMEIAA